MTEEFGSPNPWLTSCRLGGFDQKCFATLDLKIDLVATLPFLGDRYCWERDGESQRRQESSH
jgi:hypothetical protein